MSDDNNYYSQMLRRHRLGQRVVFTLIWALLIFMALGLVACTTAPVVPALPDEAKTVNFDQRLLQHCTDLPKLTDSSDTAIVQHEGMILKAWVTCRTNNDALVDQVKKAFNIK